MKILPCEIQDKIKRVSNLPTLPQLASSLLSLTAEPSTSAENIATVVGQDISLSAKIMKLANSAYYGSPREISTIQTAVVRLGFKVINMMVLSLTVFDMFPEDKKMALFNRTSFWKHCIRCAVLAKILTSQNLSQLSGNRFDPEEAFCAGLLHDIGKVVMEQYLHNDFSSALGHAREHSLSLFEAETELLGYTHSDIASLLISRWELPNRLYYPIVYHHNPDKADQYKTITSICHCADYLCYDSEIGMPDKGVMPPLNENSVGKINFDKIDKQSLKDRFENEFEKAELFIEIIGS